MAIRKERIFIDADAKRVVASFGGSAGADLNAFVQGDTLDMELYFGLPDGNGTYLPFLPDCDELIAGLFPVEDLPPTGGTWTATFGANTTAPLAYNISEAALATALNGLASIAAAGGVTVASSRAGAYLVSFVQVGVRSLLVCVGAQLLPSAFVQPKRATVGSVTVREVQFLQLIRNPAASQRVWTDLPGPSATVQTLTVGEEGSNEIQRVDFAPLPIGGLYKLKLEDASTAAIPWNARASEVQAALEAVESIGAGNVSVAGSISTGFTIAFQGALAEQDVAELQVQASGLQVLPGKRAFFDLTDYPVDDLLGGKLQVPATFEIEIIIAGKHDTLLDEDAVVLNGRIEPQTQTTQGTDPILTIPRALSLFLAYRGDITSLSGDGENSLDFLPTAGLSVPKMIIIENEDDDETQSWRLIASTEATVAGVTQRPLDYDVDTNATVWKRRAFA